METKLTTITPTYRSFVPDQVLTAEQLNEFLNFFDDQDRLSRIFLSGVGIVCGFKVSYENGQMTITQGAGIDTDGDLLKLSSPVNGDPTLENIDIPSLSFLQYRQYDDPAQYKPYFWRTINGSDVQLNLLEAIPAGQAAVTDPYISALPNLSDLVVLLYLENYAEDPSACTGINCENQGIKNIRKLRVLLVSQADADYILSHDEIFDANYLISTYLNLDEVAVQRVTVNATNSVDFSALRSNYLNAMQAENIIDKLKNGFSTMLGKLGMSSEATQITTKLNELFGTGATYPQLYFQYRYDLLRDVVNAYNELKSMFMDSVCGCNPDILSFPKHLLLGRLIPLPADRYLKSYRHDFYKSPILEDEENWCERFDLYVDRVISMLLTYQSEVPGGEIRITPSSYRSLIENKAIPFYYNLDNSLLNAWNFDKYQVNKQNRNLSYHTSLLDSSGPIQLPLKYNLEPHNFLAIEGHQGYAYNTAIQRINALKTQYGLAFDVKALGITINPNEPINMDDYACHFEDLQILLDAWTQEHECLLGKVSYFFSAFSTAVPGYNYHEEDFTYPVEPAVSDTALPSKDPAYNAVKANLYNDKNALGSMMIKTFDQFRGCSGRDIIAQVDRLIDRLGYDRNDATVDATLKAPNEVISYAYVMMDKRPIKLVDIRPDVIQVIDANAVNLCAAARRGFIKGMALKGRAETQLMLINLYQDITTLCCAADKLKLIHEEIERRKQDILIGLSLAKFQEQHPGMEHLAGVHQGDTFLLVYVNNAVNGIAGGTIVADFTLPYLCCSDCRPIGFIMPPLEADLRLSTDTFCIGTTTSPIELYPYPADGTVEFSPTVPGITVNGNQLIIDTTLIPENQIGQPISFTVNDIATEATLTFYKTPQAQIVAQVADPVPTGSVPFNVEFSGDEDPTAYSYLWEFGDGQTSTEAAPLHRYILPVNSENKVTVTLTVTPLDGSACPLITEKELQFVPVTIYLPMSSFCENDPLSYRVGANPKGANINPTGMGIYQDPANGVYMFSPQLAGPGMIAISNNGVVELVVQVNPVPEANIVATIDGDILNLNPNLLYQTNFYWEFTNEAGDPVHDQVNELNPSIPFDEFSVEPGQLIKIILRAWNDCAEKAFSTTVTKPDQTMLCSTESANYIVGLREQFNMIRQEGTFSEETQLVIFNASQFYEEAMADMTELLAGGGNSTLGLRIKELGTSFFNQILITEEDKMAVAHLYHNMMRLGLAFVRCQSEELFNNDQIIDMIKKFTEQMDPENEPSLPSIDIPSNSPENLEFTQGVLNLRQQGSPSWQYVDRLLEVLSWIPA